MANETGDMKILGNFRRLIDIAIADVLYKPSNVVLSAASFEAKLATAIAAVNDISVKIAPNKFAIDARQAAYAEAIALVRGSRNILKASGASVATLADADTFGRKVLGLRKSKKQADDANTPGNEAENNHSASQQSYDGVLGNYRSYVEIVRNEALYKPNESQYQIANLTAKGDDLEARNNAVSASFVPLSSARALRDELLYMGENCLCDLAQMVKAYVKAIHGANSQIYKTINALSFKRSSK
jgi:hypothetical protein